MSSTGGVSSAFGYHYQYLATIECFLRYMRPRLLELHKTTFFVETSSSSASDDDKVDFSVKENGSIVDAVQVKASMDTDKRIYLPATKRVFDGIRTEAGAVPMRFVTNRTMAQTVEDECALVGEVDKVKTYKFLPADNAEIVIDSRAFAEIRQAIIELIIEFRRDRHLGLGRSSATYVLSNLVDFI